MDNFFDRFHRERIHVLGNPVEHCPRCIAEGVTGIAWRPHRHIGDLKIRYICERHFDKLESNHHFDIPLCPLCSQVLYLYDFNIMLGIGNARRLHKYVLKCSNRHVLPLLDLFCQTKKAGEKCNANFKLQWCYGTMVKRCEQQKNRDHDLWWVRYKNEWKQRRTIIRYKKDFLSHLTDSQRFLLLGLGQEGEPPPEPKTVLGPAFDALINSATQNSPMGSKIKKRAHESEASNSFDHAAAFFAKSTALSPASPAPMQHNQLSSSNLYTWESPPASKQRRIDSAGFTPETAAVESGFGEDVADAAAVAALCELYGASSPTFDVNSEGLDSAAGAALCDLYGTPRGQFDTSDTLDTSGILSYFDRCRNPISEHSTAAPTGLSPPLLPGIPPALICTGTPTAALQLNADGSSPVAVSIIGEVIGGRFGR